MRRYLIAAFAGRLADAMWLAPVLFVLDRTGSAALAGFVLAAATLPTLVSAPLIGAWLDAHGHRRTVIAIHFGVLATALAAMVAGAPAVLCALLAGCLQPLVTGGFSSMVPALATDRLRAASYDSMTYNVASVGGPAVAGIIAALTVPAGAVLAQAAIALLAIPVVLSLPRSVDGVPAPGTLREGIVFLATHARLRAVTLVMAFTQVGWGLLNVVAPALAVVLGAHRAGGGLILAGIAAGALAGAALLPRTTTDPLRLVLGGTLLHALALVALAFAPTMALAIGAAALAGLPQGLSTAAMFSARAEWSPPHLRAQVFTSAAGLRTGLYALGAALAGPVLAQGARPATVVAAALCALSLVSAARASGSRLPAGTSAG